MSKAPKWPVNGHLQVCKENGCQTDNLWIAETLISRDRGAWLTEANGVIRLKVKEEGISVTESKAQTEDLATQ